MSADPFVDDLDKDLSWRKKEISDLYIICQSNDHEILAKSLLLIIYSHWEGFIKNSSKLYLQYVSNLDIKMGDLTYNYKTISIKGLISECIKSTDTLTLENELRFIKKYTEKNETKFKIKDNVSTDRDKSLINTQDNLSPKVFFNICKIVGLPEKESIRTKTNFLDEFMLGHRNAISHGNKINFDSDCEFTFSLNDISQLKNIILEIMMQFKEDLCEYAIQEYYFHSNDVNKLKYDLKSDTNLHERLESILEDNVVN